MKRRLRPWTPVLVVAIGFVLLAWMVNSAHLLGYQLITPGVPPEGVPPQVMNYLSEDLIEDFPDNGDLANGDSDDFSSDYLQRLAESLSAQDLAELSNVLSDDVVSDLVKRKAGELSADDVQDLYDSMDAEVRDELLDEVGKELTQDELDSYRDELSPEVYDELSQRTDDDDTIVTDPSDDATSFEPDDQTPSQSPTPAESTSPDEPSASDEAKDESDPMDRWLSVLLDVAKEAVKWLLLAAAGGLAGYLVFRCIQALAAVGFGGKAKALPPSKTDPDPEPEPEPEVAGLRQAVQEGLLDIDDAADPRRGVIVCWQRLERAAAAAGLGRLASETPGELVQRVLTAARVDVDGLNALVNAYHRARYGPHEIAEELRQEAKAALAAVDAQLAAAVTKEKS